MKGLPLEGIRVIDAGEVLAGAHGATLLADMGAEVIKIEAIQRYQSVRGGIGGMNGYADNDPGEHPWNRYAGHNDINRNKMGITLNLNDPRGIKLYKSLVAVSDIVIENFRTGVMAKFGLDYPDLVKVNPQIILVSLPGFGRTGPYATYASMGTSNDGASGHTALRGYIGDDPSKASGIVHVDGIAALNGATAAIIALYYRLRTGKGTTRRRGPGRGYDAAPGGRYPGLHHERQSTEAYGQPASGVCSSRRLSLRRRGPVGRHCRDQ